LWSTKSICNKNKSKRRVGKKGSLRSEHMSLFSYFLRFCNQVCFLECWGFRLGLTPLESCSIKYSIEPTSSESINIHDSNTAYPLGWLSQRLLSLHVTLASIVACFYLQWITMSQSALENVLKWPKKLNSHNLLVCRVLLYWQWAAKMKNSSLIVTVNKYIRIS
jgi:hypothetical protein